MKREAELSVLARPKPGRARRGDSGLSLTDRAYQRLEEMIATLRLAPGAVVSEAALSKMLNIGRTPIREALQRLARDRLVIILPRRGIVVAEVNVRTQLRLLEMRREIERLIMRRAARRATPEERARFMKLAAEMDRTVQEDDDIGFLRLDDAFNNLAIEAARNEFAAGAMTMVAGLSRRFWYIHYKKAADLPQAARLHAAIARAIAAGEEDEAAAALDRLMDYVEAFTRATVDDAR
jgi:DNA-binding GntR family transcriptional regulator